VRTISAYLIEKVGHITGMRARFLERIGRGDFGLDPLKRASRLANAMYRVLY
jgi:hypothetical protein